MLADLGGFLFSSDGVCGWAAVGATRGCAVLHLEQCLCKRSENQVTQFKLFFGPFINKYVIHEGAQGSDFHLSAPEAARPRPV